MSPVTHFFAGWVLSAVTTRTRRERALITAAGIIPDLDGLGYLPEVLTRNSAHPLLWFSQYHHALHNLAFALTVAAAAFLISGRRWKIALLAFLSFHLHLFCDLIGARGPDGYQWPIPYLLPFSKSAALVWQGQWALNAWPNIVITVALLLATLALARKQGVSPLEFLSENANRALVAALRARLPIKEKQKHLATNEHE
ncbi:MAG: metal-dependent hydrolase [Acidobacteriia bacterium]|nr:metal-dependent hydrolase [Terriglobia bacterium]